MLVFYALVLFSSLSSATSCVYSDPETKNIFGETIVTIGDSITWGGSGGKLRCMLRDKGLQYDFAGRHVDGFGFRHEGEGGDTTTMVLNRLAEIPTADSYLLLIGTNDTAMSDYQTVENIIRIALGLRSKNDKSIIYISTLLPRGDQHNGRNQSVNRILQNLQDTQQWFKDCYILDAGAALYNYPNWQQYFPDNVHPNELGYDLYTDLVMSSLSRLPSVGYW